MMMRSTNLTSGESPARQDESFKLDFARVHVDENERSYRLYVSKRTVYNSCTLTALVRTLHHDTSDKPRGKSSREGVLRVIVANNFCVNSPHADIMRSIVVMRFLICIRV